MGLEWRGEDEMRRARKKGALRMLLGEGELQVEKLNQPSAWGNLAG